MKSLSFDNFREINVQRCEEAFFPLQSKSGPWWGNAMAGECGEACNVVKKIDRDGLTQERLSELANELADIVTYADLLAAHFGIDLGKAVVHKFDLVSERVGSKLTLRPIVEAEPEVWTSRQVNESGLGGDWFPVDEIREHTAKLKAENERLIAENKQLKNDLTERWEQISELNSEVVQLKAGTADLKHRAFDVVEGFDGEDLHGSMPIRIRKLKAALSKPEEKKD